MQPRRLLPVLIGIVLLAALGSVVAATAGTNPATFGPSPITCGDGSIADWGVSGTPDHYDMGAGQRWRVVLARG